MDRHRKISSLVRPPVSKGYYTRYIIKSQEEFLELTGKMEDVAAMYRKRMGYIFNKKP
jgi:hypothetical protein